MNEIIEIITVHLRTLEREIKNYKKQNGDNPVLLMNESTYLMLDAMEKIDEPGEDAIQTDDGFIATFAGCIIVEDANLKIGSVKFDEAAKYKEVLNEETKSRISAKNPDKAGTM